jgi:hypothetical protein
LVDLGKFHHLHQGGVGQTQLNNNGPLGDLGLPELDGSPLGSRIEVYADHRNKLKKQAKISKTTLFR